MIVLMGAAGAGKTTVGRALADAIRWRFVEGDDFHPPKNVAKMHAGVALTDEERAPWLEAIHSVMARAIERRENTIVACSALKRDYRDTLRHGLRTVRFVYLRAAESELRHRLATRKGHFVGPSLLSTQLSTLEEPTPDEATTVEATWPPERVVKAIRREFGV